MKNFSFCYSIDGVLSLMPMIVRVKAENKEKALIEAEKKLKSTNTLIKSFGYTFVIYS